MMPPCHNCKERQVGCHGNCDKYKSWSDTRQQKKEEWDRTHDGGKLAREVLFDSAARRKDYVWRHKRR